MAIQDARAIGLARNPIAVRELRGYDTPADLFASTEGPRGVGSIWEAGGHRYEEVSSGQHRTTDGGVKLKVLRGATGYDARAFSPAASADNAALFLTMIEVAAGQPLTLGGATLRLDSAVVYDGPVDLRADGGVIDCSNGGSVDFDAGLTALPDLAADIPKGGNEVEFVSAHGLSVGEVFCVWNPDDFSWSTHRTYYQDGDWMKVAEVVSTTEVRIFGSAPDTYASADMECYKIGGGKALIRDMSVNPRSSGFSLRVRCHENVIWSNVAMLAGSDGTAFEINRCYGITVDTPQATVLTGGAYPLGIVNSKKINIRGNGLYSHRHSIGIGGDNATANVPNRDIICSDIHAEQLQAASDATGSLDVHGNSDRITYVNCHTKGANLGGRDIRIVNSIIHGSRNVGTGRAVYCEELRGGLLEFENCLFKAKAFSTTTTRTVIHILPYRITAEYGPSREAGLSEDLLVKLTGCTIIDEDGTNALRPAHIQYGTGVTSLSASHRVDVEIRGLTVKTANLERIVLWSTDASLDVTSLASLMISDDLVAPACALAVFSGNTANANMPMRLPKQTLIDDTIDVRSADAVSTYIGDTKTYKWSYPRVPVSTENVGPRSTSAFADSTSATKVPQVYARSRTASAYRARLRTGDGSNFGTDLDVRITAQVWINDL